MNKKRKIYYLFLLFFSTLLISSCGKKTSDNFQFSSSITPSASSKPYFKLTTASDTATMTMDATASEVTSTKNETTYKNIAPNTDVVYKKIENGIKEEIILSKLPDTPPVYKFTLDFGNLKPQYFEGQYYFFDSDGYARFTIPKPFMIDAAGVKSEAVSLKINNNLSTVTPDYKWLSDPKRQYPITIDPTIVTPSSPIRELFDRRTISAKTYDLGGGKYASTSGLEAVHYQDSSGRWQEKDTTIVPSSDPEYNFMNTTNNFQTFFSTDGFGQKKAVKFQVKDAWMKFKIISASGSGQKNEIEDNKFEFKEISKNGDKTMAAAYTLEADQLLEEVVLNKFQGFPQIKQEIELHNAVLRPDGKKINAYHSTTNELLWVIPEPVMYELNRPESRNYGLHYEISCQNTDCSNLILSKVIDPEGQAWLSDQNQNYPLVIDTTAGPNSPGTASNNTSIGGTTWANPTNAFTSNDMYAEAVFPGSGNWFSCYLVGTNFSFSIATDQIIDGIIGEIERHESSPALIETHDYSIKMVKLLSPVGTNKASLTIWPISDSYIQYGGNTDLWGTTWTYSEINSSTFGIAFSAQQTEIILPSPTGCYPPYCSLDRNSLVSTPFGYKKINNIKVGDKVFSYNEKTKKIEIKKVLAVQNIPIKNDNNRYFYIYYDNKIIKATENHQFYINGSYLRADQLRVGDLLLGLDLIKHPIEKIEIIKNYTDTVWDITVEDNHNFFVEGILTHNVSGRAYVDHLTITIYHRTNGTPTSTPAPTPTPTPTPTPVPAMRFEGVKMEGVKINAPGLPPTPTPIPPTPTPIPPTPTDEPECIPAGSQCDDWGIPCCSGICWQGDCPYD